MIPKSRSAFAVRALVFGLTIVSGGLALAQPKTEPPKTDPKAGSDFERLIYLPYKNLQAVLDNEKAAVFIPYAQYLKLWEAYRPQGVDSKPPVGAVLTEAKYTGTVEKDTARITADLTIRVLGKPWVELPVQFGDAAIGKITSPENKVLLQATGNGKYILLLPEAGEHKVQLELVSKVHASPDGRSLELAVPPAGVTSVDLTVPAKDQAIELVTADNAKPAVVTPVEGMPAESTHVKAQLGSTERIVARWRPRVSTAPVMELLASVQTVQDIRIADGLVHTHAMLNYQVQRGQLDQLRILIPANHRILDVTSPGLKSWKATAEAKQQVLAIDLLGSDSKTMTVEIHTEQTAPTETFAVGGIADDGTVNGVHATGGVRETGLIVLSHAPDLTLAVERQSGLVRVEASDAPEALRKPEAQFYRYYSPKFNLRVLTKPVEPRVLVDNATTLTFTDDELKLDATLNYTVERAGLFELRLNVPEGLVIDRVDCPAMKEFQAPAGQKLLIVVLRERTQGSLPVTVAAHRPLDPASKDALPLPILEPVGVERETGTVRVLAPESIEVLVDEKGLQGAQPSRDLANAANLPPQMRLASAWTYTRRPVEIPVTTTRRPTRLLAGVGTVVNVRQDTVDVTTTVNFVIDYAGVDTFRIAVPKAVADTVQIDSGSPAAMPVKQKQKAEPEGDWVTWTIVFQRELTGIVPLTIRYDLKPAKQGSTATMTVSPIRALGSPGKGASAAEIPLSSMTGELTVQKDRSLSIKAVAKELEPIDVRDLKMLDQDGYLAFRYYRQPEKLEQPLNVSLTATLHDLEKVADTVVLKAAHEAVVTTDDTSVLYRTRFLVKTSERQRLPLDLPKDTQVLDTQVAGRKVDLEVRPGAAAESTQGKRMFVNVARTGKSDEPFVISIVFRAPFTRRLLEGRFGGLMGLSLPRIPGGSEGSSVPVLELRAAVWVPKEYELIGKPAGFTPVGETTFDVITGTKARATDAAALDGWFGAAGGGLFDFTPAGHPFVYEKLGSAERLEIKYWPIVPYTWLVSGTVFLVGLVLSLTSWENRLWIVLIAAFAAVLGALYDPDLVLHGLAAARWGLVATLAFWLLRGVTRPRTTPEVDWRIHGGAIAAVIPPPGPPEKAAK